MPASANSRATCSRLTAGAAIVAAAASAAAFSNSATSYASSTPLPSAKMPHPAHAPTEPQLVDVQLQNAADPSQTLTFKQLWADKPVIAVFLRRLGCALCRVYCQDLEKIRGQVESMGGRIVCISHERFGEGSDADRSFEKGGYWKGQIWADPNKQLYSQLLGRKGLLDGYGLFNMSKEKMAQVKERKVEGNYKGDGFQLGGSFVIDTDGTIVLDHRQKFYGDDATTEDLLEALRKCKGISGGAGVTSAVAGGAGVAAPAPAVAQATA